ncbi:MAG: hypothetical protein ACTHKP_13150, partial [Nitrososphaeraceae archaeon]
LVCGQLVMPVVGLLTYFLAWSVKFFTNGWPTLITFSNPLSTPEENIFHPNPIIAKTTTTNNIIPNRPITT